MSVAVVQVKSLPPWSPAPVMYVHGVQMPALLYVPSGQYSVHVSMLLIFFQEVFKNVTLLPVHWSCATQAETLLSPA